MLQNGFTYTDLPTLHVASRVPYWKILWTLLILCDVCIRLLIVCNVQEKCYLTFLLLWNCFSEKNTNGTKINISYAPYKWPYFNISGGNVLS